jgi:thioredoxin-like negative regulator of GroEL
MNINESINGTEEFANLIDENAGILFYFSHDECNVCKVLKPKVAELIKKKFPLMKMFYVDVRKQAEIAGQNSVFTVPTILLFFGGKEYSRRSRNVGIEELAELIERPYKLMFE